MPLPDWITDYSPEASFQSSAVGMLHRLWFHTSWTTIKKLYGKENDNEMVSWEWYNTNIVPDICMNLTFARDTTAWNINLKMLLQTPVYKMKLYQEFMEQPSDALIFPIVGKAGVFHKGCMYDNYPGIWFVDKDGTQFVIESLDQWAARIRPGEE